MFYPPPFPIMDVGTPCALAERRAVYVCVVRVRLPQSPRGQDTKQGAAHAGAGQSLITDTTVPVHTQETLSFVDVRFIAYNKSPSNNNNTHLHKPTRARVSSECPEVPLGNTAVATPMCPCSTRVKHSRSHALGSPKWTVRVMSVVPSTYCAPLPAPEPRGGGRAHME